MSVGAFLRAKRRGLDYSLRDIVEMTSSAIDKTTLSRIEKGERHVSLRAAYNLAAIYGLEMEVIARKAFGPLRIKETAAKKRKRGRPRKS